MGNEISIMSDRESCFPIAQDVYIANFIFVFMPGVARPSFQSAGSYPAQTIMNAFL